MSALSSQRSNGQLRPAMSRGEQRGEECHDKAKDYVFMGEGYDIGVTESIEVQAETLASQAIVFVSNDAITTMVACFQPNYRRGDLIQSLKADKHSRTPPRNPKVFRRFHRGFSQRFFVMFFRLFLMFFRLFRCFSAYPCFLYQTAGRENKLQTSSRKMQTSLYFGK